jgi:hypothetical protein
MKWKYRYFILLVVFPILFYSCNSREGSSENDEESKTQIKVGKLNPDAPVETELMGQLAGSWNAEQTIIGKDGTWSSGRTSKGIWRWYYILDGQAIQDDWISIDSSDQQKTVGTNIRIYNPDEKLWYMAWIDKTHRRLATFTATNVRGNVVMDGTNSNGKHIHNIFYNIKPDTFGWKQEWTFDEGISWVEVARIHCTRITD